MMILQQPNRDADTTATWQVRVAVRIPRNDGTDLLADATRRLETTEGVESAEVVELRDIEPALSATVVRLTVRVETRLAESTLETRLADAPGMETVTQLERE